MEANPLFDNKLILAHISCEIGLKKPYRGSSVGFVFQNRLISQ